MNFFANFGRVNTISINKIAAKSHKLCITSFWYIPEILLRNRVRGHIANVTDRTRG